MPLLLTLLASKVIGKAIPALKLGHGSTWPGHIALKLNRHIIAELMRHSQLQVVIIAGTNGKTTSSLMLRSILEAEGKTVLHNEAGANLLNGIASTLVKHSTLSGKVEADYAVFEVDENALPGILHEITPHYLLILNLFRDQLDRYGEVATVAEKWQEAFAKLPETTTLIVNADDPKTAYLGMQRKNTLYYGLPESEKKKHETYEVSDSSYCPKCHNKLSYHYRFYSHLGNWYCPHCRLQHPTVEVSKNIKVSLSGTYNLSNAHGIIVLAHKVGTRYEVIANSLRSLQPAFGRQEKIQVGNKTIQVFLAKNPTGFNESLRTIADLNGKNILLVLNDRIADGTDVSWIWDIDIESFLPGFTSLTISGDRAYDMGLRVKYAQKPEIRNSQFEINEKLDQAIEKALETMPEKETLYILPTYTAMLEVREILTGRKIL